MADAVARAASVPAPLVRRAAMLSGNLGHTAVVALTRGEAGLHGGRARGRPGCPADARGGHAGCRNGARRRGAGVGRMEARRRAHPGAPRRRRRARATPAISTTSRAGCPASSEWARALPVRADRARRRGDRRRRRSPPTRVPGHDELVRTRARMRRRRRRRARRVLLRRRCTSTATTSSTVRWANDSRSCTTLVGERRIPGTRHRVARRGRRDPRAARSRPVTRA